MDTLPSYQEAPDSTQKFLILRGNQLFCEMLACHLLAVRAAVAQVFPDREESKKAPLTLLKPDQQVSALDLADRIGGECEDGLPPEWLDIYVQKIQYIRANLQPRIRALPIEEEAKTLLMDVIFARHGDGTLQLVSTEHEHLTELVLDFGRDPELAIEQVANIIPSLYFDPAYTRISFIPKH